MLPNRNREDKAWHELQKKMQETRCTTNMASLAVLLNDETNFVVGETRIRTTNADHICGDQDNDDFRQTLTSRLSLSLERVSQRRTECSRSLQQLSPDNLPRIGTSPPRRLATSPPCRSATMTSQASVDEFLTPSSTSPTAVPYGFARRLQSFISPQRSNENTKKERMLKFVKTQNLAAVSAFNESGEFLRDPKATTYQFSAVRAARTNVSNDKPRSNERVLDSLECTKGQGPSQISMRRSVSYQGSRLGSDQSLKLSSFVDEDDAQGSGNHLLENWKSLCDSKSSTCHFSGPYACRDEFPENERVLDSLECTEGQPPSQLSMHGDVSFPDTRLGSDQLLKLLSFDDEDDGQGAGNHLLESWNRSIYASSTSSSIHSV
jgi:hypothetical protein